jgi:beta-carotene 3-hydroxylase
VTIALYILIVIATYAVMEGITWCTHKFVMHGFLWSLHKDHHQPKYQNTFERNDLFFVIGAVPSILLFYYGTIPEFNYRFFVALGVLFYGITYFLVHDVLIHQRFNWFKNTKNAYLRGLRLAHKIHHKQLGKEDGECFGMLNVPKKYFKRTDS